MKFKVEFGTAVKSVTVEAKSKKEAEQYAWDEYDTARDTLGVYGEDELIIKSVTKIK